MANTNRVVVVTGGGSGIGLAIAQAFAENGDKVAILGRTQEKLDQASETHDNIYGFACDIQVESSVQETLEAIHDQLGTVDVLVNNAGLQRIHSVEDFPLEDWDQVIGTILTGTFLMTKYCLPDMQAAEWGRVITISSGHGRRPDKYKSAYVASKYGQIGFTATVAMENAQKGITANCILPGATNTDLIQNQLGDLADKDGTSKQEALETHILGAQWMKQLIEPEEIGALAVFLASDGAAKITGESIGITGGE
ncbi:SDR family NAD(P)-dependent oxidoreductase [Hutsoniella sourekii]|uniref:SDR family NAD(P)-dependent oxidoreductase n=1 Tax=Hutsoniella sourekii TaxID=87650 RepID=UPI000486C6FE|nr:SDR family NAD(P)-dependent oxidoreductase [Hutsoniella sourekii]